MQITYIKHSGFLVELENHILLFDYFEGEIPELSEQKEIYIFASHSHQDHFNRDILKLKEQYPNARYIFPKDIKIPKSERKDFMFFLKKRDSIEVSDMKITSFRSTDEGVAFLVECEGKCIYHAGDLNWWHWEEEGEAYNRKMRGDYQKEISDLAALNQKMDVAFVVLDPRQEEQYYWGLEYFALHTQVDHIVPMHMWEEYQICEKLYERAKEIGYDKKIQKIHSQGERFEL